MHNTEAAKETYDNINDKSKKQIPSMKNKINDKILKSIDDFTKKLSKETSKLFTIEKKIKFFNRHEVFNQFKNKTPFSSRKINSIKFRQLFTIDINGDVRNYESMYNRYFSMDNLEGFKDLYDDSANSYMIYKPFYGLTSSDMLLNFTPELEILNELKEDLSDIDTKVIIELFLNYDIEDKNPNTTIFYDINIIKD